MVRQRWLQRYRQRAPTGHRSHRLVHEIQIPARRRESVDAVLLDALFRRIAIHVRAGNARKE